MGFMQKIQPLKIEVKFELREDGGLRAWSDDLPGFVLSHSDPEAVINDIPDVLSVMLSAILGRKVEVFPTVDVSELLGIKGPMLPAYMTDRTYMGRIAAAC